MKAQNLKTASPFTVVLIEPEIPSNTGNIARTCVATGSFLELVEPLGFSISDKALKRAGLDYWPYLKIQTYKSWEEWIKKQNPDKLWMFSVRGKQSLYEVDFLPGDKLVFGKETQGLPKKLLNNHKSLRIPFVGPVRSLNLSNSATLALYEALRQNLYAKK